VKAVVPADEHPEDAVPRRERKQDEEAEVVDVLFAEPPQAEREHALHAEEEKDAENEPFPVLHLRRAAMPENFSVV